MPTNFFKFKLSSGHKGWVRFGAYNVLSIVLFLLFIKY